MKSLLRRIGMESASTKEAETEVTIYARIGNHDGFQQATGSEVQFQVEARLGEENYCRVRKTVKDDTESFVYTFKLKNGGDTATDRRHEFNLPVDEAFYEGFYLAADKLQRKTRYFFKAATITLMLGEGQDSKSIEIPDVMYEVDVFKKPNGVVSEWCKIDVEVDSILKFLDHNHPELKNIKLRIKITHLPFQPMDAFIPKMGGDSHRAFLDELYKNEFNTDLVRERAIAKAVSVAKQGV